MRLGKRKISFQEYGKLCELLLECEGDSFAYLFLVLESNIIARSGNVVDSHVEKMYIENDALVFQFAKTKCNQTGKNADQLRHVYATPKNPATCPFLTLARYLLSNPGALPDVTDEEQNRSGRLFPSKDQYHESLHTIVR